MMSLSGSRIRVIALCVLLALAGCGGVQDSPSTTATTTSTTPPPTDATVSVEGDALPVNATLVLARVEALMGTSAGDRTITVYVDQRNASFPTVTEGRSNSLRGLLMDGNGTWNPQIGGSARGSTVSLTYPRNTSPAVVERTLAHEFVHVLQPTDLRAHIRDELGAYARTPDGYVVQQAIVEGSAVYVTDQYARTYLPDAPTDSAWRLDRWTDAPTGKRLQTAPYLYGARYVEGGIDSPANLSVVYADPPRTTEQLLHGLTPAESPVLALGVETEVENESWNTLPERGPLGELFLRVLLEDRLNASTAAEAAAGWGTDRVLSFDNGAHSAYVWVFRWDTPRDANEFARAFTDFAATRPADDYTVETIRVNETVVAVSLGPDGFTPTVDAANESVRVTV